MWHRRFAPYKRETWIALLQSGHSDSTNKNPDICMWEHTFQSGHIPEVVIRYPDNVSNVRLRAPLLIEQGSSVSDQADKCHQRRWHWFLSRRTSTLPKLNLWTLKNVPNRGSHSHFLSQKTLQWKLLSRAATFLIFVRAVAAQSKVPGAERKQQLPRRSCSRVWGPWGPCGKKQWGPCVYQGNWCKAGPTSWGCNCALCSDNCAWSGCWRTKLCSEGVSKTPCVVNEA